MSKRTERREARRAYLLRCLAPPQRSDHRLDAARWTVPSLWDERDEAVDRAAWLATQARSIPKRR